MEEPTLSPFYTVQLALVDKNGYLVEVTSLYEGDSLEKARSVFHETNGMSEID